MKSLLFALLASTALGQAPTPTPPPNASPVTSQPPKKASQFTDAQLAKFFKAQSKASTLQAQAQASAQAAQAAGTEFQSIITEMQSECGKNVLQLSKDGDPVCEPKK